MIRPARSLIWGLGGPSLRWLHEALKETRDLTRLPAPDLPCATVLGSDEQIVDSTRIRARMQQWPGSHLDVVDRGKHELLMDTPDTRNRVIGLFCSLFDDSRSRNGDPAKDHAPRSAAGDQG